MSDALYLATRGLTVPVASSIVAQAASIVIDEPAEEAPRQKKSRRSYLNKDKANLLNALLAHEAQVRADYGSLPRGWLRDFVISRNHGIENKQLQLEMEIKRCSNIKNKHLALQRKALADSSMMDVNLFGGSGGRDDLAGKRKVQPHKRRRRGNGGRTPMNPILRQELFCWFIDIVNFVKARITSTLLLLQARIIISDLQNAHQEDIRTGKVEAGSTLQFPKLDGTAGMTWIYGWRLQHHLSWRTVNLRFKCSYRKLKERLCLFWTNVFVIRWIHYFLNGRRQILRFSNSDEKPLWVTTAAAAKTLASRIKRKTTVNENVHGTRERFTAKTLVEWPRPHARAMGKRLAVMFKGVGTRLREELVTPPGVLLQFSPKGSYRSEQNLEYYKWLVEPSQGSINFNFCMETRM